MKNKSVLIALAFVAFLAACKGEVPSMQKWVGKWIGPEGTFLILSQDKERYDINIQSLDGLASYQGKATDKGIQFERDGKTEIIHAGDGQATGMKWLREKKNCLVIQTGEGFCRD